MANDKVFCLHVLTLMAGHQEERQACKNLSVGRVICLDQGASYLHMVHLMPLPPHHLLLR